MTDKITIDRETAEQAANALLDLPLRTDREVIAEALRAALAAQPAGPVAWIPVSDRLPTERQEYVNDLLVRNKYGNVDICSYDGYAKYFETGSSNRLGGWPVIEWLPLSAQPASVPPDPAAEMDAVAIKYAHKMALDLECILAEYGGSWYNTAMQTLGEYRSAMNAIHERESPTFMGEPVTAAGDKP